MGVEGEAREVVERLAWQFSCTGVIVPWQFSSSGLVVAGQ